MNQNGGLKQVIRVAIVIGKMDSGGKKNLVMEYYRHIDRSKVQFDCICDSDSQAIPEEEIVSLHNTAISKNICKHA